jgi:hypothetical protein
VMLKGSRSYLKAIQDESPSSATIVDKDANLMNKAIDILQT